jgi:hypothetical protein
MPEMPELIYFLPEMAMTWVNLVSEIAILINGLHLIKIKTEAMLEAKCSEEKFPYSLQQ